MKLRAVLRRMLSMSEMAWYIFIRSIQLSCFLLFCAFILMLKCGGSESGGYELYMTARSLYELPQALLLIAGIASACIDELQSGKS